MIYWFSFGLSYQTSKKKSRSLLQNDGFLVIRYHIAVPDDLGNTVRILLQLSTYYIEVLLLSCWKSSAVSSEMLTVSLLVACPALPSESVQEGIRRFVAERQLASHPIVVSSLDERRTISIRSMINQCSLLSNLFMFINQSSTYINSIHATSSLV